MNGGQQLQVRRIARFSLTTTSIADTADFYSRAFGFRPLSSQRLYGVEFERLMEVDCGADSVTLGLGAERLELLQFDRPGQGYPRNVGIPHLIFQHFALVVRDMEQACQRLATVPGWSAISRAGPEHLPPSSGSVTAFKFRDPEGHPLELLTFPTYACPERWQRPSAENFRGIDHTAICVGDTAPSIAFYRQLGLHMSAQSLNHGPEQERLDDVANVQLKVTALRLRAGGAHIELLCYRQPPPLPPLVIGNKDVAAVRMVLDASGVTHLLPAQMIRCTMQDPDGHRLVIAAPAQIPDG